MRRRWAFALVALTAGCGTTTQPAASPEPPLAAAPEPAPAATAGPALRFEPGASHRYRVSLTISVEMPSGEAMGKMGMEIEQEAVHRIETPAADGAPRVSVTPAWTRLVIFMEGAGLRLAVDSRDPATLWMIAEGGPMEDVAPLFGGESRLFEVHGRQVRPVEAPGYAAPLAARGAGPGGMFGGMDPLLLFAWVDLLPPPGVEVKDGNIDLGGLPGIPEHASAEDVTWRVLDSEAATGRLSTELRVRMKGGAGGADGEEPEPGEMELVSGDVAITDVFEGARGVYGSRRLEMEGEGSGGPAGVGEGNARFRMDLKVERLGDGSGTPAKQP